MGNFLGKRKDDSEGQRAKTRIKNSGGVHKNRTRLSSKNTFCPGEGGPNDMCSDRFQNFCGPVISMCPPLPSPPFLIWNVSCNFPNPALHDILGIEMRIIKVIYLVHESSDEEELYVRRPIRI